MNQKSIYNKKEEVPELELFKTPDNIKIEMNQLREMDNYHGVLAALEDYLVIGTTIYVSYYVAPQSWLVYLIALVVIGSRHRGLATLLHESSHHIIAKNGWLNHLLGVVGGWPVLQSHSIYVASHVKEHHHHIGDPYNDPDYKDLIDSGMYGNGRSRKSLVIYLVRLAIDPTRWLIYLFNTFKTRMYDEREDRRERISRLAFYAALVTTLYMVGGNALSIFALYWLVPLSTTTNSIGSLLELVEHYPLLELYSTRKTVNMSRNRTSFNPFINFFLNIHEERWHLVHHLYPKIPFWNQQKAHNLLMQNSKEYASLHTHTTWTQMIQQMLQDCDKPLILTKNLTTIIIKEKEEEIDQLELINSTIDRIQYDNLRSSNEAFSTTQPIYNRAYLLVLFSLIFVNTL